VYLRPGESTASAASAAAVPKRDKRNLAERASLFGAARPNPEERYVPDSPRPTAKPSASNWSYARSTTVPGNTQLLGEIAGGGQPAAGGERPGENCHAQALVNLPEQTFVFLRKWYREFHRKWVYTNTTSRANLKECISSV
jgi:hypothetical protein